MKKLMTMFLMSVLLAAGCATSTTAGGKSDAVKHAGASFVVQFATMKYISNVKSPDAQRARAERVIAAVSVARSIADGGAAAAIPDIELAVRDAIDWTKISAADRLLIDNLIMLVRAELVDRFSDGTLRPEQVLAVRDVLTWVESGAAFARAQ